METIIIIAIFVWYLAYKEYATKEETKVLIRELTVSLKSTDIVTYTDNTPVYKEEKVNEIVRDELVPIEDVDPTQLLRSITAK